MMLLLARFLPGLLPAVSALFNPLVLVTVAVAAAFVGWQGYRLGAAQLDRYIVAQQAEAIRITARRAEVTERVVTNYIKVKGDTEVITRTIEKEVVRYADSNPGYALDGAWRVLHDAAAANVVPDPAGIPYGTAGSPPRAAEALETVTASYAACHKTADRLEALQEWVRGQAGVR